jgi:hypothetical protein
MAHKYQTDRNGFPELVEFATASAGTASAGQGVAANAQGFIDDTFFGPGIGRKTVQATASGAKSAGAFVNLYGDDAEPGVLKSRLADNSNGRPAHGFITEAVADAAPETVYFLDDLNDGLSGLTVGAHYWLGTAGGVISTPLDSTDSANDGKLTQYLGIAISETTIATSDSPAIRL